MQALIGFTQDPGFWNGLREYAALKKYAAKPCTGAPTRFAVSPGDTYVLAGQEGTFSTKGTYDKNGVRQRMNVTAAATVALTSASLTHTWLCISCPWIAIDGGPDPFVMLAWRDDASKRGRDRKRVEHVPVADGKVRLRVIEREDEETRLDELVIVVRDAAGSPRVITPVLGADRSALAKDDGAEVRMKKGTAIRVEYDVSAFAEKGEIDFDVVASGYYVTDGP